MTQPQKKTRRQMLEEFVAAKPNDAFARYGLAMECANSGDASAADQQFQALLTAHPDYVAAYFQYGQYLARIGRVVDVLSVKEDSELMIVTKNGQMIRIDSAEIRQAGRSTSGVRLVKMDEDDRVAAASLVPEDLDKETGENGQGDLLLQ